MHAGLITAQLHTSPLIYFQNYLIITGKCSVICSSAVFLPLSLWLQFSAKCNTFSHVCKRIQCSNEPKPSKNLNNSFRCLENSAFFLSFFFFLKGLTLIISAEYVWEPRMAFLRKIKREICGIYSRLEVRRVYYWSWHCEMSPILATVTHLRNGPCYSSAKTA